MPTTQTPPTTITAADLAKRMLTEASEIALAAEQILWQTEPPYDFSAADLTVLRMAGFTQQEKLNGEIRRIGSVKRHLADAGSPSEFAAAEKSVSTTQAAEKRLTPQLEATIREAQAKLNEIRIARQGAEARLTKMESARVALRSDTVLPTFCVEEVNVNYRHRLAVYKQRIAELVSRLNVIDQVLLLDSNSARAKLYAEKVDREQQHNDLVQPLLKVREDGRFRSSTLDAGRFAQHRQELRLERGQVASELAEAREAFEQRKLECDVPREFYLRKLE